ncbi:MAG: hypothetical protein F4234_01980 [Gammaproteobacteria bacterium]|nr:hypothetical protein [Gammaproteobacteria bacterium]MYA68468.1 hypothetical protein [Gammaproteobacteria bacterium]MYE98949.1 hypothetical protein [Gammaproteobacteria bacterium]MYH46870.1 hypothetical protein [Gammaproteobacteria bacterium]MYL13530.1 hypothetical protein [Gammaproteobacteria bacterium]
MLKKILVYWRDIPSQVIVQRGRRREKVMLSDRFQQAIDRAAMRAGKGGSGPYLAEWRRETTTVNAAGELREIARAEARRFEEAFSDERLEALIKSHGRGVVGEADEKQRFSSAERLAKDGKAGG